VEAVADVFVKMYVNGSQSGTDKAFSSNFTGNLIYGGASDLWGNDLTPEIVNASNFGVALTLYPFFFGSNQPAADAFVDVVTCTVTYTINVPTVGTLTLSAVSSTRATARGEISSTGGAAPDIRGFVFSTATHALPANVAPAATGYESIVSETGSFPIGTYSLDPTSLLEGTTYYIRAFARNSVGYSYGNEVIFNTLGATISTFSGVDPADLVKQSLDFYNLLGGQVTYSGSSITLTGHLLDFKFNTDKILTVIKTAQRASPNGYYWTVDVGTGVLTFKPTPTTADYTFIKGVHLNKLKIIGSTQGLINKLYFSGGEVTPSVNLYKVYEDTTSINDNGQRIAIRSDNRVTVESTADAMGQSEVDEMKEEQYYTTVTILDTTMDISLLTVGKNVAFRGFGSFVDDLLLQIVRIEYTPDAATLQLGILPRRLSQEVEEIKPGPTGTADNCQP
jgi:hypothetical protein